MVVKQRPVFELLSADDVLLLCHLQCADTGFEPESQRGARTMQAVGIHCTEHLASGVNQDRRLRTGGSRLTTLDAGFSTHTLPC